MALKNSKSFINTMKPLECFYSCYDSLYKKCRARVSEIFLSHNLIYYYVNKHNFHTNIKGEL